MTTNGTDYLLARANNDSRLAGLLDDLYRERRDGARHSQILRDIDDLAWHRGKHEFSGDDADVAARTRGEVSR